MNNKLSPQVLAQLEDSGVAITGDIGGIPKRKYWTPDGRQIVAIPAMRNFVRKDKDGKSIETGTRDANYDKGWLPQPPTNPIPYCKYCDKWHTSEDDIAKCGSKKKIFEETWAKKAKQEVNKNYDDEINSLKSDIADIKQLLTKLLESK